MTPQDLYHKLLLDSGASTHLLMNKRMLTGVHKAKNPLILSTNGGDLSTTLKGQLPLVQQEAWLNQDKAIANLLSLGKVSRKYQVTMDTWKENAFTVHTLSNKIKFVINQSNLYEYSPKYPKNNKLTTCLVQHQQLARASLVRLWWTT